jgi:predicted transcriptional regulator
MLTPCEVAVKTVSPAIRALLAQTLTEKYQMKEREIADILGITQSAVSKYNNKTRGTTISLENLPDIKLIANQIAPLLLSTPVQHHEIMKLFCEACTLIRSKGLMCELCKQNQKPEIEKCSFCDNGKT